MARPTGFFILSASAETICVPADRVDEFWPHVRGWLSEAIAHCGDWTIDGLHGVVSRNEATLWVVWDGKRMLSATVTEAILAPRGRICRVLACGGERAVSWKESIEPIERYARETGCVAMRIEGRPGWRRVFDDYSVEWITLEKGLR
jgi:hypothetical protein